nr:MAG TPA: hypothetical protein [Caudoviricetes sp.]
MDFALASASILSKKIGITFFEASLRLQKPQGGFLCPLE